MTSQHSEFDSLVPGRPLERPFSRRDFIATTAGVGFALATQPIMAQTAIHTDSAGLVAGRVKVPSALGEVEAYQARPAGQERLPVILVVSEIFGVHEYIADVCRRLAKLGYLAIAPEVFARQGDPRQIASVAEILEKITARTPDAQVLADLDACAAWAFQNGGDPGRLGITGFCYGGRITWLYSAYRPSLRAGVAWYGRLEGAITPQTPRHPLDVADDLKAPVLGLYGGLDTGIPLESVEKMETVLQAAAAPAARESRIVLYDQAPHAFHADYRPSYRKEDAEDGWKRMLAWFRQHGL
ncbi:dienelactone hydrolase family protein [Azovibrio restrictus]|uniref:dienelactone hydrolase family protein n=1 Tax=Azovibrio restrictus TaxID=146938 RepID=UPI0026E9BDF3|nr:dienelactone hydrolase family protein [Azovibrio restrictus]